MNRTCIRLGPDSSNFHSLPPKFISLKGKGFNLVGKGLVGNLNFTSSKREEGEWKVGKTMEILLRKANKKSMQQVILSYTKHFKFVSCSCAGARFYRFNFSLSTRPHPLPNPHGCSWLCRKSLCFCFWHSKPRKNWKLQQHSANIDSTKFISSRVV